MAKRPSKRNAKKKASKPATTQANSGKEFVTIRAQNGVLLARPDHPERLPRLAQQWNYVLRGRARWASDPDLRCMISDRAIEDLNSIGVHRDFLRQLALVDCIEVELHDWDRSDADATRIHEAAAELPWEYLISAATRSEGRFQSLLITRLFRNGSPAVIPRPPEQVLFVESAPGRLKDTYEFGDEEDRIRAAVGATGPFEDDMLIKKTSQIAELREEVKKDKWDAIHVTGIDAHQAGWFVKGFMTFFRRRSRLSGTKYPPRPAVFSMEWYSVRRARANVPSAMTALTDWPTFW